MEFGINVEVVHPSATHELIDKPEHEAAEGNAKKRRAGNVFRLMPPPDKLQASNSKMRQSR
jgi:hypothetical protein